MWNKGDILGGQYLIQEKLGEGGFGTTYKAWHNHLRKSVVIKTPNSSLQNNPDYARYVRLFKEEAQRLDSLLQDESHPHIVKIRDLFQDSQSGNFCIVMDFIDGKSLLTLIEEEGKLSEKKALKYINEIASALIFVHDQGIVHRDAHPGNIMIDENDRAILIDFGIATGISYNVNTYRRCGSEFAPPDQFRGNSQPTVDIYTLAASLYYAVTSNCPQWDNNDKLIAPIQYVKTLNPKINRAILRGMSALPKDRPQSMDKWAKMLVLDRKPLLSQLKKSILILFDFVAKSNKNLMISSHYKQMAGIFLINLIGEFLIYIGPVFLINFWLNLEKLWSKDYIISIDNGIWVPTHFYLWLPLIYLMTMLCAIVFCQENLKLLTRLSFVSLNIICFWFISKNFVNSDYFHATLGIIESSIFLVSYSLIFSEKIFGLEVVPGSVKDFLSYQKVMTIFVPIITASAIMMNISPMVELSFEILVKALFHFCGK